MSNGKTERDLMILRAERDAAARRGDHGEALILNDRICDLKLAKEEVECPSCRGQGEIASPEKKHWSPCRLCSGTGAVTEQQAGDWPETP